MGELVSSLAKISTQYDLWMVVIIGAIPTIADQYLVDHFESVAKAVGKDVVVSKMMDQGIIEAERVFQVGRRDARPVIVVTQKHPSRWSKGDPAIKIELGKISDRNQLALFLQSLCADLSSGDFGRALWTARAERIRRIGSTYGISAVSLIGAALGSRPG